MLTALEAIEKTGRTVDTYPSPVRMMDAMSSAYAVESDPSKKKNIVRRRDRKKVILTAAAKVNTGVRQIVNHKKHRKTEIENRSRENLCSEDGQVVVVVQSAVEEAPCVALVRRAVRQHIQL
jgi:hypothetical protein